MESHFSYQVVGTLDKLAFSARNVKVCIYKSSHFSCWSTVTCMWEVRTTSFFI